MVMMHTKQVKPFVRFEIREFGLNEEMTRKAGRPVPKMEEFICITSHGSRDSSDQLVNEWLPRKRREAEQGMYDPEWVDYFEHAYKTWKSSGEVPREGTPILSWQMLKAEQSHRLRALGVTTVEDLSAIPDQGLDQLGLDGRVMRDLAKYWITEGQQKGINAQELANANQRLRDQQVTIDALRNRLEALEAARETEPPKRRKAKAESLMDETEE